MNGKTRQSAVGFLRFARRAAILCTVLLSGYAVSAQMVTKPFSADKVVTKRGTTTTSKVYATSIATRTDGEQRGKKFIAITRWDRKVLWSIMPDQKMYVEMQIPVGPESASAMNELAKGMMKDAQVKKESLGAEQVEGFLCDKTRMTVTWQGITSTTTEWAAKELGGFVLKKQDDTTGELTEYKNIQLGPQDPSLFELPAGYQKMSLGGFQKPQN